MRTDPVPFMAAGEAAFARSPNPNDTEQSAARALIARLRAHVEGHGEKWEQHRLPRGRDEPRRRPPWNMGLEAVDRFLPVDGLARSSLHDVAPQVYGDFPAATGFALALAARRLMDTGETRPLLWCRLAEATREYGRPYGHGLESLGIPRARFLTVTLSKSTALFWTLEEALKSGVVAMAIGDANPRVCDLTTSRRLLLAAQAGHASGLLVFTGAPPGSTASASRWRVASGEGGAWKIALTKARGGRSGGAGEWIVNWRKEHAAHHFNLVSGLSGGLLHPRTAEETSASGPGRPALRAG